MTQFSSEELAHVANRDAFLAKARITLKIREMLAQLHAALQEEIDGKPLLAPERFDPAAVQIVKGEHLEDCPYQYLDFPKHYTREEKFSFRTLWWWGHHIACAVILEGPHLRAYKENLINRFGDVADRDLVVSLSPSLWEWKSGPGYTMDLTSDRKSQTAAVLAHRSSLKVVRFVPFDDPRIRQGQFVSLARETLRTMLPIMTR